MGKCAVVATYEIASGQIGAFLPLLLAHRDRCLETEPGTLRFDVLQPETNLMLYDLYENETAFEAHRNGVPVARFREEAAGVERKLTLLGCSLIE